MLYSQWVDPKNITGITLGWLLEFNFKSTSAYIEIDTGASFSIIYQRSWQNNELIPKLILQSPWCHSWILTRKSLSISWVNYRLRFGMPSCSGSWLEVITLLGWNWLKHICLDCHEIDITLIYRQKKWWPEPCAKLGWDLPMLGETWSQAKQGQVQCHVVIMMPRVWATLKTVENKGNSPLYWAHLTVLDSHCAGRPFQKIPLFISSTESPSVFRAKWQFNIIGISGVASQSCTSGCLVTSGHCWPSAADEEWYSSKRRLPAQWQSNTVIWTQYRGI